MRLAVRPSFWLVVMMAVYVMCVQSAPTSPRSVKRHHRHERNNQERMRRQDALQRLKGETAQCCPTNSTTTAPLLARSATGMALELYRGQNTSQKFHETVCSRQVVNRQCRFIEKKLRKYSRCVQQYSLVYALVRDVGNTRQDFRMDYVRIRTGCSCTIVPPSSSSTLAPS